MREKGTGRSGRPEVHDHAGHATPSGRGHIGKIDAELFKGVGILLIVLHNYFHWVAPSPGENEFTFSRDRTAALFVELHAHPLEALNLFFSYFGHYGVQLFVFLSAYGLTRAYGGKQIPWTQFVWRRVVRLYPTFVLAVVAHAIFVVTLWNDSLPWFAKLYALKLSMLSAFYPGLQLAPVGPWWFFSMIFQFYVIYLMLDRVAIRYGGKGMLVVGALALVGTALGNAYLVPNKLNLYFTVIGHLPVLCLGMWAARRESFEIRPQVVGLAAAIFVLGMWLEVLWYFAPLCATILLLAGVQVLRNGLRKWNPGYTFLMFCGGVSLPLFAIHGMMRSPFVHAANESGAWYITLALAVLFLVASLFAALAMQRIEDTGRRWLVAATRTRA